MKKELKELVSDKEKTAFNIKWMLSQAAGYRGQLFVMLIINLISLFMSFAGTIVGKYVVDSTTAGIVNRKYIIYMAASTLFSIAFSAATKYFGDYINEKFSFGMRCEIFDRIQRGVWLKISEFHSGDIVTRLTSDVSSVSSGLITVIPSIIVTFLQLVMSFGILFYFDKPLAFFALALGPVGAVSAVIFRKKYQKYQKKLRETESRYRSFIQESVSNLGVVKSFQCEDDNNEEMQQIRKERMSVVLGTSRLSAAMSSLMRVIYSSGYVAAFCWGAYRISVGEITYGTMTLFLSLVSLVQGSVTSLGAIIPQIYSMLVSAGRITEITGIKSEAKAEKDNLPDKITVELNNVSFSYAGEAVLRDVNCKVGAGEKVGVVGSSGAGKTTLIRLLLSLVEPDCGEIIYTDENGTAEKCGTDSRRFISYVPQGNTLSSGTVRKNLLTGKKNASDEELWAALKLADADKFVEKLPRGLDTPLSEKAGGISEGQAQRISIARALLRDRALLILDEATSALDEKTEENILSSLSSQSEKTCFIITHRRSMLRYCDKVIEIADNGSVNIKED